jgi:hypothetical protein
MDTAISNDDQDNRLSMFPVRPISQAAENRLEAPKDLFDLCASLWARCIPGMTRRPPIDTAGSPGIRWALCGMMRRDAALGRTPGSYSSRGERARHGASSLGAVDDEVQEPVRSRGLGGGGHARPPNRHRDYNHNHQDYQENFPSYGRIIGTAFRAQVKTGIERSRRR